MKRALRHSMCAPAAVAALLLLLASVLSAAASPPAMAVHGADQSATETAQSAPDDVAAVPASREAALVPMEDRLLSLLNADRTKRGLQPLHVDATLESLARARSSDMASRGYFSHVTPEGTMVFNTMDQMQIPYKLAGENLARNSYPPDQSPDVAHQGFMNSPKHAENDYDPDFNKVGIGVAVASNGMIYFTELFAILP